MNQHERGPDGKCVGSCRECAIEAAFNRGYNLGRTDQKNAAPPPKAKQYRDALRETLRALVESQPYFTSRVEDIDEQFESAMHGTAPDAAEMAIENHAKAHRAVGLVEAAIAKAEAVLR